LRNTKVIAGSLYIKSNIKSVSGTLAGKGHSFTQSYL